MRSLAARFLLPVGGFLALLSAFVLYQGHVRNRAHVEQLMDQQARLALEFDLAIRDYVADEIRPRAAATLGPDRFEPETMSTSFVARSVFERVRERFPDYIIKFSSDNPRNPANQATPDELEILRHFNAHPETEHWSGHVTLEGQEYLAHFQARRMTPDCLACHGAPTDAPTDLLQRYGPVAAFHRPVGEVIALDTVAIPTGPARAALARDIRTQLVLVGAGLALTVAVITLAFRLAVTQRLRLIGAHFQRLATQAETGCIAPLVVHGRDEVSVLANSFNQLAARLHAAYALLEERVTERTAALQAANAGLQREIAQRREAEQATRASEERYRLLAEHATDIISRHDDQGRFTYVSPACQTVLGYAPEELLGRGLLDFTHPEDQAALGGHWEAVLHDAAPHARACRIRRNGGAYVWLEFSARVVTDGPADRPREVICIARDVTERHYLQEAQRSYTSFLETLFNTIPAAIFSKDTHGRYVSGNQTFFDWVGRPRGEVLRRTAHDLFPPEYAQVYAASDEQLLERPGRRLYESVLPSADGTTRNVLFHKATYTDETGNIAGLVGVIIDITDQKQSEANLQRAITELLAALEREKLVCEQLDDARARAEESTRAKSAFLANMSHEIRTPLTAITGFAELLSEDSACCRGCSEPSECALRERNRQQLDTILANSRHLLDIINDILDLSKIEAGQLQLETVPCSPLRLVAEVQTLVQPRADAKQLALNVEFPDALPETIDSDPTRLRQILLNLVGNALKFTERGHVRLVTRYHADPENPRLRFEIEDTGIGISAAQQARLFEPFTQADSSTTRRFGGTGLGLAISKRLAEALGGEITVVSTSGSGSTFTLTLPVSLPSGTRLLGPTPTAAPATPPADAAAASEAAPCRVLLAEDGVDNQRLINFVLARAGIDVTIVENGQDAVASARAAYDQGAPFDVILMDMQMPVLDGYEATKQLRDGGYEGPIIALTAHALHGDRERCLAAGCDAYVSKPIDRQQLVALVRNHAQRNVRF